MKQQALKPETYVDIRSVWKQQAEKVAIKKGVDEGDDALYALSQTRGWEILREHINNLRLDLDKRLSIAVSSGMNEAEIGKSAVVAVLAKDLLESIVHKVEDAAEAVDEITNEQ